MVTLVGDVMLNQLSAKNDSRLKNRMRDDMVGIYTFTLKLCIDNAKSRFA